MVCSMLVVMDVDVSFVSCTVMISGCVVCASCLSFSCLLLTSSMLTCRIFLMKLTLLMEARQEENDSTNKLKLTNEKKFSTSKIIYLSSNCI